MSENKDSADFADCGNDLTEMQWLQTNREAIAAYNEEIDKNGVFRSSWKDIIWA